MFFALAVYALGCLGVRFAVTFVLSPEEAQGVDLWLNVFMFGASVLVALFVAGLAWLARIYARFRRR